MLYIGVDLGTSAVKLLLMDGEGKIRNIVSKEYPLYFPHPGWSEQKPEDWYEQVMAGIRELIKDADKSQVAGISFGGQMHGLVILDKDDNVIRPAILWNDGFILLCHLCVLPSEFASCLLISISSPDQLLLCEAVSDQLQTDRQSLCICSARNADTGQSCKID